MLFHTKFYELKDKYLKQGLSEFHAVSAAIAEIQYIVAKTGETFVR